jgi:DNA repair protein SbcC/Rad50
LPIEGQQFSQLKYDPKLEQKLLANQEKTEDQLSTLTQKLLDFKTELQELQRELNQVLKDRHEPLICETMTDLIQAKTELEEFIEHHQQERSQTLTVIRLLEKIEQKEKAKVTQLFGEDSVISQDFAEITNQKYDQVVFDQLNSQIKVRLTSNQQFCSADKLSAGSYDQLYFAIRLGLGQKLLGEEQGFFILDDPFLKSDQKRLKKQLDMLMNFAKKGWQIVYFSAKDEVKEYVQDKAKQIIQVNLNS